MVTKNERSNFRKEIKIAEHNVEEQENQVWETTREFYKGNHKPDSWQGDDFLVVNFIHSNIVSQMPALTFTAPEFSVKPGGHISTDSQTELSVMKERAMVMEDVMNQQKDQNEYQQHFRLVTLDSLLSIGIFKVYHKVNMGKNPKAGEPKLDDDGDVIRDHDGNIVTENDTIPTNTEFHVDRVKPENFLVDPRTGNFLESASWVAERVMMKTDIARRKFGDDSIPAVGKLNSDIEGDRLEFRSPVKGLNRHSDISDDKLNMSVMYEVYDTENNRRFYLAKGLEEKVFKEKKIPKQYLKFPDKTPYVPLKHHEIPDNFYPIPDVFPAAQINLSYDMARNQINQYRKQFVTKYFVQEGALEPSERRKLESNQMGGTIETKGNPNSNLPIFQFDPPSVPSAVFDSINLDKQDIREVSGITGEQTGGSSGERLASQSILKNRASNSKLQWKLLNIKEAAEKVGKKLMALIQEYRVQPGTIFNSNNFEEEAMRFEPESLQGDFELEVAFGSTQPDDKATEQQKFLNAIQTIAQFPPILQHFNTRELAEEFTKHFPVSRSSINNNPDPQIQQMMQQGGQGGSGGASTQRSAGQGGQAQAGANQPQPADNGNESQLDQIVNRIQGGIG